MQRLSNSPTFLTVTAPQMATEHRLIQLIIRPAQDNSSTQPSIYTHHSADHCQRWWWAGSMLWNIVPLFICFHSFGRTKNVHSCIMEDKCLIVLLYQRAIFGCTNGVEACNARMVRSVGKCTSKQQWNYINCRAEKHVHVEFALDICLPTFNCVVIIK